MERNEPLRLARVEVETQVKVMRVIAAKKLNERRKKQIEKKKNESRRKVRQIRENTQILAVQVPQKEKIRRTKANNERVKVKVRVKAIQKEIKK